MNNNCIIRLARRQDLACVKILDDLAFAEHQGITMEELEQLLEHGAIFLLLDPNSKIIGESQVLLQTIPEIPHQLSPDEAYYYGTGIHPDCQGNGYGGLLADKQDEFAIREGKRVARLTLRVENYPSMKLRIDKGFLIVDYLPEFYGPAELDGARVLMTKQLLEEPILHWNDIVEVSVSFSNAKGAVDLKAHAQIQQLLNVGYKGFSVTRAGILFGREFTKGR